MYKLYKSFFFFFWVEGMPPEGDHHLIDDFYISGRRNFMPPLHLEPGPQGPDTGPSRRLTRLTRHTSSGLH